MNPTAAKLLAALLLCLSRFTFGIMPIFLFNAMIKWEDTQLSDSPTCKSRRETVDHVLAGIQSFGGGVLFATCFIHMIPQVRASMATLRGHDAAPGDFPFAELFISLGFFTVYFVEEFSHWFLERTRVATNTSVGSDSTRTIRSVADDDEYKGDENSSVIDGGSVGQDLIDHLFGKRTPSKSELLYDSCDAYTKPLKLLTQPKIHTTEKIDANDFSAIEQLYKQLTSESRATNVPRNDRKLSILSVMSLARKSAGVRVTKLNEKPLAKVDVAINKKENKLRACIIIVAVSIHAVFEGITMGLDNSSGDVWILFTAMSIHGATILYCVGFEMVTTDVEYTSIVTFMAISAMASPTGIICGLLINLNSNVNTPWKAAAVVCLEGLSAGTILYITFFEVLNREKSRRRNRLRRSVCIVAGFGLMVFLQVVL